MRTLLALVSVVLAVTAPVPAAAATHTVIIEGMKFTPGMVTVQRGDRITWQNKDVVPHTATAAGSFDSGSIAPGARWSHTFGKAGRLAYVCRFHPGMNAQVVVQ